MEAGERSAQHLLPVGTVIAVPPQKLPWVRPDHDVASDARRRTEIRAVADGHNAFS